jgi:Cytochrome c3
MNIANQITYIATDTHRQVIPWVQVKDPQGHITTYVAKGATLTQSQIDKSEKRRMDCIDCHDQPSHIFTAPDRSVDNALLAHRLDPGMPFIKQEAVNALTAKYNSTEDAMQGIARALTEFYSSKYPQLYSSPDKPVQAAIAEVRKIYSATFFPYMRVDWRTHPNNLGHYYFAGCFRCHDDQHVSADGRVIPKKCDTCHTVLEQVQTPLPLMKTVKSEGFQHPVDLGDLTQVTCSDCHTGANM